MHIYKIILPIGAPIGKSIIKDIAEDNITDIPMKRDSLKSQNILIDLKLYIEDYGFGLSDNEINNFITHIEIWKLIKKSNVPWALVIESCVNIDTSYKKIKKYVENLPIDWDIFFPYDLTEHYKIRLEDEVESQLNYNFRENRHIEPYYLGYKWGNSIYCISRKGVEKILGSIIISDRLDNTLLKLSIEDKINSYMEGVSWYNIFESKNWEWKDRLEIIWNIIWKNNQWTNKSIDTMHEILRIISSVAININIDIVLSYGSLLGYVRNGSVMPWDDDIDFAIDETKLSAFFENIKSYENLDWDKFNLPGTKHQYYKIWKKDGEVINGCQYTFPFIDLWCFNKDENDAVFNFGDVWKDIFSNDLVSVLFEGSEFKIPYNYTDILDSIYKDWKTKIRVYEWSHKEEKEAFRPLIVPISVDKCGRQIGIGEV